ncbi:MAG: putative transcriptional regulator, Crp/Fnr family [Bacteroidetes bacterium]|jgi:CRP-like cAMP-binding protein|nr:putative transcriptional regulator, Crp/Fnr family [Bacteroidota bacterium]
MPHSPPNKIDTTIFLEELRKRVTVPEGEFEKFLELWEFKKYKRNEFILKAGEVPEFSIFVLEGCLRQYIVNEAGEESIVYFAEERHWIGDLPAMRSKSPSAFNFQAIEECKLLVISAENWEKAFIDFPWWAQAHLTGYQKWTSMLQQKMAEMQTHTGETRYLNLLKEKPKLFQRVPQHYIASYLGISAETLSRIRKKLSRD